MISNRSLIPVFLIAAISAGNTAMQTDWSGGPVEPGPVAEWGTSFHHSISVDYSSDPGELSLMSGKLTDCGREIPGSMLYAIGAYPGDVDLDGDLDILVTSSVDNQALWWENTDGEGTSWTSHQIASDLGGAWGAVCYDIDKDGDNDIFGSAMGADVVLWWENADGTGTTWNTHSIDDSFDGAKAIAAVDLNDDGEIDLTAAAKTDNQIVCYLNQGSGAGWIKVVIADSLGGANSVFPCDFDEDGDWDVLAAAKSAKAIRWYENTNGSGTAWTEHSIGESFDYARTAEAADFDGDGDIDVLATGGISKASGTVCWWENTDGTATQWTQHTIEEYFPGPYTVLQCDFDQDGDPDVLSGSLTESTICWWENQNQGTEWEKHVLSNYYAPRTVSVGDIDGDGDTDVFAGSLYSFNVTIWEMFGYQEGTLHSSILDTQGDSDWTSLEWAASLPADTEIGISLRSSWDETQMGEWSDTVYSSPVDPSSLIDDNDRFVQYAVIITSDDPESSPVLSSISLAWNPLGIGGEATPPHLSYNAGNPQRSSLAMSCSVPSDQSASLMVFDLSGRCVYSSGTAGVPSGSSTVSISGLTPGVYMVKLQLADEFLTAKCTVTR